jgi:hypothetical protein
MKSTVPDIPNYFLRIESDIDSYCLDSDIQIQHIAESDWPRIAGVSVEYKKSRVSSVQRIEFKDRLCDPSLISDPYSPVGFSLYENNYYVFSKSNNRANVTRFDRAVRLLKSGQSGLSHGIGKNIVKYLYPSPGWKELPISEINKADLTSLEEIYIRSQSEAPQKFNLVVERYLHATQGTGELLDHSRLLDLVSILEILLVDDGRQGEITYKLRMRGAGIFPALIGLEAESIFMELKTFYNARSEIVHQGNSASKIDWQKLTNYSRVAIVEYLKNPEKFNSKALDNEILKQKSVSS